MSLGSMWGDKDKEEPAATSATVAAPTRPVTSAPLPPAGPTPGLSSGPTTGYSIASGFAAAESAPPPSTLMSAADWGYARGALGLALTGPENSAPVPWANPDTGTRGTFAAAGAPSTRAGAVCRDFLASRVENGRETRLSGKACRSPAGHWDIADVKRDAV